MIHEKEMKHAAVPQTIESLSGILDRLEAGIAETDRHGEVASKIHGGSMETLYRLGFARPEPMPGGVNNIDNDNADLPKLTTLQRLDRLIAQLAAANGRLYCVNQWNDNILRGALDNQL